MNHSQTRAAETLGLLEISVGTVTIRGRPTDGQTGSGYVDWHADRPLSLATPGNFVAAGFVFASRHLHNRCWYTQRVKTRLILFDLGETLVAYCRGPVFARLLPDCLDGAARCISDLRRGLRLAPVESARVEDVNHERTDYRVTPLLTRLAHVFRADLSDFDEAETAAVGSAFVEPITAIARVYEDTLPTLDVLLERGLRLGLVSNTPWGSPAGPWRAEIAWHGMARYFEHTVFCAEVGWRKPHPAPFLSALDRFAERPQHCLFVGDRPDWDIDGAKSVGMRAILIDRDRSNTDFAGLAIDHLGAILEHL